MGSSLGLTLLRSSIVQRVLSPILRLSGTRAILEGSPQGTGIGTFEVVLDDGQQVVTAPGTWVITLPLNGAGHFQVTANQLEAGAVATDYETAQLFPLRAKAVETTSRKTAFLNFNISVADADATITDIVITWLPGFEDGEVPDNITADQEGTPIFTLAVEPAGSYALQKVADPDAKFRIEETAAGVWIGYLIAAVSAATHAFTARAIGADGSFDKDFSISRVIVNDPPSDVTINWSTGFENGVWPEDTALGTKVFDSIDVVDDDVADTHTVTLDDPGGKIRLIAGEGILVGTLHAATEPTYAFTVQVVDQDDRPFSKVIPVNVAQVTADSAVTTLLARSTVSASAQREVNMRRLYARLKRAGWIAACDFLFVPKAHTQQFANENWIQEVGELSPQNGATWVQDGYYESDSVAGQEYVALGINPLSLGTLQMLSNDIFGFVMLLNAGGATGYHLGAANSRLRIRANDPGSNGGSVGSAGQNNTLSSQSNAGGAPPAVGVITQQAGIQRLWRNGGLTPVDQDTVTPAGLPSDLYLFRNASSPTYVVGQVAVVGGGKCPSTFLAERIAALYYALIEYNDRVSLETSSSSVVNLAGTAAGTSSAVGTLNIGRLQGRAAGTSTVTGQLSLGGSTVPLPDIDLMTTTAGISYARAGQMPYIDASGAYALAAANVWPLDHDPSPPHAALGRRLMEDDVLVNYGTKRTFSGWTPTRCTFGANAGYTTWFGDTLGGRLTESTSAGAKFATSPVINLPGLPISGPMTSDTMRMVVAATVKKGATWTNRRLRMIVQRTGSTVHNYYADFDLDAGTRPTAGETGSGQHYSYGNNGEIIPLKDGFFRIISPGVSYAANQPLQIIFQLIDKTTGATSLPSGTANYVEIDDVTFCAATSKPPIFGALSSIAQATVGMTGISIPIDMGMTDESGVEYYRRQNKDTENFGVIPVGGVAEVLWPLETIKAIAISDGKYGRFRSQFQEHQHLQRVRGLVAGAAEPFVFPAAYAATGKTVETKIIPSSSPFAVTLSGTPGDPQTVSIPNLTRVVGAPAAGQFSVSGAVVTFNTAEGGTSRTITWYPAIQTCLEPDITGGGAAAWQDITNPAGSGAGTLHDAWHSSSTTPRRYRLGDGLPELLRYQGNAVITGGNITLRGNGQVMCNRGGGLQVGNSSMLDGKPFNILVEDFTFAAGEFPPGSPGSYKDSYCAPVSLPLTNITGTFVVGAKVTSSNGAPGIIESIVGSTLKVYAQRISPVSSPNFAAGQTITQSAGISGAVPAAGGTIVSFSAPAFPYGAAAFPVGVDGSIAGEGVGYINADRDSMRCWAGTRTKFRHCTVIWGLDETWSVWNPSGGSGVPNFKDWVIELSIIAEALNQPKDPIGRFLHDEWQSHACGLLIGYGKTTNMTGACVRNVTGRFNVISCCSFRSPLLMGVTGMHWYNNIAHRWGGYGIGLGTRTGQIPFLASIEGNIFAGNGGSRNALVEMASNDETADGAFSHLAAYHFKDNVRRSVLLDPSTEQRMTFDFISPGLEDRVGARVFMRERPFYTDRVPMPTRTPAEVDAVIAYVLSLAGSRERDVSDNPIPGSAGAHYHTQRILADVASGGGTIINYPSQVDGYKMTA